jgi:serine/threonine-protein kinase
MAVVYKAYDTRLERDVAMKVIRTGQIPPDHLKKLLQRFEREAKSQAKFDHPHIVPVHDYGEYEGSPYLVMAYRPGGTMKQMIGKPIPYQKAAQLLAPIGSALAYAHKRNILHRDVKPSNILISEDGVPAITDFGIAKLLETEEATLTGTGVGIGTPEYMAPEQWRGKSVHQTDIFALGVVFYELVTGRKPYEADTPAAIILLQVNEPLPRPSEFAPDFPEDVEKVLYKALALEPEDRYESMAEFGQVLEELSLRGRIEAAEKVAVVDEITAAPEPATTPIVDDFVGSDAETRDVFEGVVEKEKEEKKPRRLWIGLMIAALVIIGGIAVGFFWHEIKELAGLNISTATTIPTVLFTPTPIPTQEPEPVLGIGSTLVRYKDGMEMAYIPAGNFEMGSESGEEDERPVHTVYLDAYWIDKYEVTNAQYALCVQAGECDVPLCGNYGDPKYDDHPVVCVRWYDALAYAKWVDGRLPTEAEWEKAARGGLEGQLYPWGNEDPVCTLDAVNGAQIAGCEFDTVEVGSFAPNGYGLYDMAGNVWEWVTDWYHAEYYSISPSENPVGSSYGSYRVLRGGSFGGYRYFVRCVNRSRARPLNKSLNYGFRVVVSP